jgi:hypothetical protein
MLKRMNARIEADPDLIRGDAPPEAFTKVKAEAALSILAYNILRAINLIGPFDLRARLA